MLLEFSFPTVTYGIEHLLFDRDESTCGWWSLREGPFVGVLHDLRMRHSWKSVNCVFVSIGRCRRPGHRLIRNASDQVNACSLGFEKWLRVTDRHAEVGAAEAFDHRERNTDHFTVTVDQRPSGSPRCRLRIVDNLVSEY